MAEAGWYPDPQDARSLQYFDGQNWTGDRRPADVPASSPAVDQTTRLSDLKADPAWSQPSQQAQNSQQPQSSQQPYQSQQPQQPQQPYQGQAPQQSGSWPGAPTSQSSQSSQYSPQYGAAPPPPGGQGWQGGGPPGGTWQTPAAKPKRKRLPLIIALVAVVIVAAGLIIFLVLPGDDAPTITYQGKEIASASEFLDKTEQNVEAVVAKRHGAKSADARCYFVQPKKPASGDKSSDVESTVRCGPVLFVDGNKDQAYLPVPFTSQDSGGKAELTASTSLDDLQPAALDDGVKLVRPDGKSAPEGSGGLAVPVPPAAEQNALVSASLGSQTPPTALTDSVITGKTTKVTLKAAGEVSRYGSDETARSAPSGQKLIAFQVEYGSGDVDGSGSARAQLVVDGGTPRNLPEASGSDTWIIAAIPKSGDAVLQLTESGFKQTLTLPAGKAGSDNIAVLARTHRTGYVGKTIKIPMRVSQGSNSRDFTYTATAALASLDFWIPGHEYRHASAPNKAILSVKLNYYDSLSPGKGPFGFDPELLRLKLPSGQTIPARNVAGANKIFDVFEVPADFTRGYLIVTGSEKSSGITLSVRTPQQFPIGILAN